MSWALAGVMIAASTVGLFIEGFYEEGPWARQALLGADLVTLVLAAPLLIGALILSRRGSVRAQVVWIGMLVYAFYDYAYYVFGATFNDAFLLHIAALSLSIFALACAIPGLDAAAIRDRLRSDRAARWVGAFLVIVGVLQGALWGFLLVRNVVTHELLHDIPVSGQHLVFALDLALLMPSLIVAGVLLYRGTPLGYLLGGAMAVMGAAYQVNLMIAGLYQANADVAGVKAFPPEGVFLTATFVLAAAMLLRGPKRSIER